jgi:hypothetical protein
MSINFLPNDPSAGSTAPALRVTAKHANRPSTRADFTLSNTSSEGVAAPGTARFLFWQCREAALSALDAWEAAAGNITRWQGNRRRLALRQDQGQDLNAYYDRTGFSFFHQAVGGTTYFSGASTDVVAHEVGHGLLDSVRAELWDATFLEAGAFHEAFADCMAVLTALNDRETRTKLLAVTATLKKANFVEATAENLSEAIRRLVPNHNAAEPRHAFNTFQFQIPETLPTTGGPGALINEVHSFGMIFSGCFYDLIAQIFAGQATRTEATLLTSAKTAGSLLVAGAKTALVTPRFFQAVGRAMTLADDQQNASRNRDAIRLAFQQHNVMLGSNTLLAPTAVLEGAAPSPGRAAALKPSTRRDLARRLRAARGDRLSVRPLELCGRRFACVFHRRRISLAPVHRRLRGVSAVTAVPVLVGDSGGHPAVIGELPEPTTTEREVHAFVESLVHNGQLDLDGETAATPPNRAVPRVTHRIRTVGGQRTLQRVRFHCCR